MSRKYQAVLLKGSSDSRAQSVSIQMAQGFAEAMNRLEAKYSQKQQPQPNPQSVPVPKQKAKEPRHLSGE